MSLPSSNESVSTLVTEGRLIQSEKTVSVRIDSTDAKGSTLAEVTTKAPPHSHAQLLRSKLFGRGDAAGLSLCQGR